MCFKHINTYYTIFYGLHSTLGKNKSNTNKLKSHYLNFLVIIKDLLYTQ